MKKAIEFELTDHPAKTPFPAGLDPEKSVVRRGRQFFVELNPEKHGEAFRFLWRKSALKVSGQNAKELAEFLPGAGLDSVQKLLREKSQVESQVPEWKAQADGLEAEAASVREAMEVNTNVRLVEQMLERVVAQEGAAKLARLRSETAGRRLAEIELQIHRLLEDERQRQYDAIKFEADQAVEAFNASIAAAYRDLNAALEEHGPRLVALSGPVNPYVGIHWRVAALVPFEGQKLQSCKTMPQLVPHPNRFEFNLEGVTK